MAHARQEQPCTGGSSGAHPQASFACGVKKKNWVSPGATGSAMHRAPNCSWHTPAALQHGWRPAWGCSGQQRSTGIALTVVAIQASANVCIKVRLTCLRSHCADAKGCPDDTSEDTSPRRAPPFLTPVHRGVRELHGCAGVPRGGAAGRVAWREQQLAQRQPSSSPGTVLS